MVQKVLGWSSESALYLNPTNLGISKYVLFFPAQPRKKAPSGFESFVLFAQIDGILNYRMHAVMTLGLFILKPLFERQRLLKWSSFLKF